MEEQQLTYGRSDPRGSVSCLHLVWSSETTPERTCTMFPPRVLGTGGESDGSMTETEVNDTDRTTHSVRDTCTTEWNRGVGYELCPYCR